MGTVRLTLSFLVCFAILILLFFYLGEGEVSSFFFDETVELSSTSQAPSLELAFLLSFVMAIGIFFGAVYEIIGDKDVDISFSKVMRQALRSGGFVKALLGSPIIFAVVYVAAQRQPDVIIALIFAFENGFFCHAVLKAK